MYGGYGVVSGSLSEAIDQALFYEASPLGGWEKVRFVGDEEMVVLVEDFFLEGDVRFVFYLSKIIESLQGGVWGGEGNGLFVFIEDFFVGDAFEPG